MLSICIPTYNRAAVLKMLVDELLTIQSDEVEFVISDNHSADATEVLMRSINDERLHYYRNDANLGPENIRVLLKASKQSKFCLLIRDKDMIPNIDDWFQKVKPLLELAEDTSLFRGVLSPRGNRLVVVPRHKRTKNTAQCFIDVMNVGTYMTSIIFPRKTLENVFELAKSSAPYMWSLYGFINLMIWCVKWGDYIPMPELIVHMRTTKVFSDSANWGGIGSQDVPYWVVESRNKQNLDMVRMFKGLDLPNEILIPVMCNALIRQSMWVVNAFKAIHSNAIKKMVDVVQRERNRSTTFWHSVFWSGYEAMLKEINSLYGLSPVTSEVFSATMNYYRQLCELTEAKELNAAKTAAAKKS